MKIGKQSAVLNNVYLGETGVVVGPRENNGPLGVYFDKFYPELHCDAKTWEKAEMQLLKDSIDICLEKNDLTMKDIDCCVVGDLNNQVIIGSYVLRNYDVPFLGVFGACSTSTEGMIIGGTMIEAGVAKKVLVGTSSHNATLERQFRYPTEYGGQKPDSLTFTVTGAGIALLTKEVTRLKISGFTIGKSIDAKFKDPLDMGRAMAPAAFSTLYQHFLDFNTNPADYDLIVTGDLSYYGKELLIKMFQEIGMEFGKNYNDCGLLIFDRDSQEVFAGGSGCGCCAAVTYSYLLKMMKDLKYKKILVAATGALLNTMIVAQKESIPGVCHAVVIERLD